MKAKTKISLVVGIGLAVALGILLKPAIQARVSWYYVGELQGHTLLVTCEANTPKFRAIGFDFDDSQMLPPLSGIEVMLTCAARNLLRERLVTETDMFGGTRALYDLVDSHGSCDGVRRRSKDFIDQCREAHHKAMDWMIANGADINSVSAGLGTPLHGTILELDEQMFNFLISRGADAYLRPPEDTRNVDPALSALIDTTPPRTVVEELELQISRVDENEFPELVSAWQRMLARAEETSR